MLRPYFDAFSFESESVCANSVSREIAKSVNRDGRFYSYFALGGSALLHKRIRRD